MQAFTACYQLKSHGKGDDAHAHEHLDCGQMTSAFVIIGRVYRCKYKCNFLRNQIHFVESTCNFEYFEENEPCSLNISEIIDSERRSYLNA